MHLSSFAPSAKRHPIVRLASRGCRSDSRSRFNNLSPAAAPCALSIAFQLSGCVSFTHASTSSGNSARARSYLAASLSPAMVEQLVLCLTFAHFVNSSGSGRPYRFVATAGS